MKLTFIKMASERKGSSLISVIPFAVYSVHKYSLHVHCYTWYTNTHYTKRVETRMYIDFAIIKPSVHIFQSNKDTNFILYSRCMSENIKYSNPYFCLIT